MSRNPFWAPCRAGSKAARPAIHKKKRTADMVFNHNLSDKEKAYLTVVIQDGFDASCAAMIESAVEDGFCRGNGDARLRTMTVKMRGSPFSIAGGVLYRSYKL